jgi:hypothetical protein
MVHQGLFAKDESAKFVAQPLDLFRLAGRAKAFGQLKECFLFLPGGFDALLDEFHQDTVVAEGALFRYGVNLFGDFWWQGYASPDLACT